MKNPRRHLYALVLLGFGLLASPAVATVVNVDIDARPPAHDVDNGVFSSPGGTTWNGVWLDFLNPVQAFDLDDEFGNGTGIDLTVIGVGSLDAPARPIPLYQNGSIGTYQIKNLLPGGEYELAIYAANPNLSVTVTDASGATMQATGAVHNFELPGDQGEEYLIFQNLAPFELAPGVIGLELEGSVSQMAGFQLLVVPEPSSVVLLGIGLIGLAFYGWRNRRKLAA